MKAVSAAEALQNLRKSRHSQWCGDSEDSPGVSQSLAAVRIRSGLAPVSVRGKFELQEGSGIYAMGSCFAREIELAFSKENFRVLSFDDAVMSGDLFKSHVPFGAGSFLFRYTTASMRMEIERILGEIELPADKMLTGSPESLLDLNFGGMCERGDLDLISARRAATLQMGQGLKTADLVVLTLGLTEAWFDKEAALYINAAPDLTLLRRGDRFEMRSLNYEENLANVRACLALIRKHNPQAKFVLTVSPIPLQATFTGEDIIVANMRSKSVLRAVAAAIAEEDDEVLYFPSYEIVMYSDPKIAWKGDRRHVTKEMVGHIIRTFKVTHGLAVNVDQGLALVDIDSNRIKSNVTDDAFQIQSGELLLHPGTQPERPSEVVFSGLSGNNIGRFKSHVQVSRSEAEPVRFRVLVRGGGQQQEIARAEAVIVPGVAQELTLSLDGLEAGEVDIVLQTEMAEAGASTAYAWAQFLSPTLEYGGGLNASLAAAQ